MNELKKYLESKIKELEWYLDLNIEFGYYDGLLEAYTNILAFIILSEKANENGVFIKEEDL